MAKPGVPQRDFLLFLTTNYIPEPNSGCWLWLGPYDSNGYGIIVTPQGKWKAHRASLYWHKRWPKEKLLACHSCDVTSCINPDHLFWGTQADNMADAAAKGRARNLPRLGEDHHKAKLTEQDVIAIRSLSESSYLAAQRYGLDPSTIRDIRRRKTWRHI